MAKTELLNLLADGENHSGQEMADVLGVSRTAVWKQLKKLEELGLAIEASRSSGYRIPGGLELLDESLIRRDLPANAAAVLDGFTIAQSIDSTNAELLRQLQEGLNGCHVCTAEQQTQGRGRRGRQWVSPFARNLYLSLTWEFPGGAGSLEGLSLAVGVACARALKVSGAHDLQLKWPNDILHNGSKLGGILIEMLGDAAGSCQVVVGVGINVAMPQASAGAIDQEWTDLQTVCSERPSRNEVLSRLLGELLPMLKEFEQGGFKNWREEWTALDAFADQPVIVQSGERRVAGVSRGVDDTGALQLEVGGTVQSIHGGEVSLRSTI